MDYREHYRLDALEFDYWGKDQFSRVEKRRMSTVFELAALQPGMKVLDIGSGRGWFSLRAAELGAEVTAVDLSEKNLQKIREINPAVNVLLADALNLPAEAGQYDLIVALEVVEHLTDPKAAVLSWLSHLKPEGRLLITVPYKEVIRYSLCIHCNQKTPINAHLHTFDRDNLIKLLSHNGYWVKETRGFVHKLLNTLKVNRFCGWLPYRLWKFLDTSCGLLNDRYTWIAAIAVPKT
jgi:2-polyprenyl-3-methyl-5-hydroxy-6-metoxy-1,4-benzoquinol methylase